MIDNRLSPMFMLRRLAERDPELLIKSAAGGADSPRPSDPLLLGELDLAFGRVHDLGREHPDALVHRLIRLEPLVALLPPEHPLGDAEVIKMADIRWEAFGCRRSLGRSNGWHICAG